jgi:hypothetical protein
MTPGEPQNGVFASWGLVEWMVGAIWTAGLTVAGFVYKQSGKIDALENRIALLEREAEMREKADDNRHKENVHILRGLQIQIQGIVSRVDQIYRRGHD